MSSSRRQYILLWIFLSAFIIRLLFILPSGDIPSSDAAVYDGLGLSLAKGEGYVNNDGNPHSFYPPFYPFFLSVIYRVFGHSYLAVRVIQSLIGTFSCVLIYLIGRKVYSNAVGALAAFISALYFPFIKAAELLLTELVFTFILCLIVFYLVKIREEGTRLRNFIIIGLLSGVALLTKSAMIFFPIFILPVFFYLRKRYPDILKMYAVLLLIFFLSMAPWIIRNYVIFNRFMPVSTQTGIGFYSSYLPPQGIFGRLATADDPVIAEADRIYSPVLRSDFLIKKTLDFIIGNPKKVLHLEFEKILYLWAPFDWEIVGGRWFNLVYAALLPFFGIGILFAFREFKRFYPVMLPIVYFQVVTLIFYGSPRFRLPIEPYMFILAAMGIFAVGGYINKWKISTD